MTVSAGGSIANNAAGTIKDVIVEVATGGTVTNEGAIENTDVAVSGGSLTNSGSMTDSSIAVSGGSVVNTGSLTDTDVTVSDNGAFTVESGAITGGTLTATGGTFEVTGGSTAFDSEVGTNLVIGDSGRYEVTENASSNWEQAAINGSAQLSGTAQWTQTTVTDGASLTVDGSLRGQTFTQTGGEAVVSGGTLTVEKADVGGMLSVSSNGIFKVGSSADFADRIGATDRITNKSTIVVGNTVHVDRGGSLTVGNVSDPITGSGLVFGSDSVTIVDVQSLNGDAAFKGTGDAMVLVEQGATLILGNVTEAGTIKIVEDFATVSTAVAAQTLTRDASSAELIRSWFDSDHLYALNEDGTGLNWLLDLGMDDNSIWVVATLANVDTVYTDLIAENNANALLVSQSSAKDAVFVRGVLQNRDLSVETKTRVLNSVAQIGAAGAVTASGFDSMTAGVNAIEDRLAFAGDTFSADGRMIDPDEGALWVNVLSGKRKADNLSAAGRMKNGYDADMSGFVIGADRRLGNLRAGVAFSYQDGSLDSTGDMLDTSSDVTTYGVHAYMSGLLTDRLQIIGSLGWFWHDADVSMRINTADFGTATANTDSSLFAASLRAESRFDFGKLAVIPHAGIRVLMSSTDDYTTKIDGEDAFKTSESTRLNAQLPIGVTVKGDVDVKGWQVSPFADLTVTPQIGKTDSESRVTGVSSGATDVYGSQFAGRFSSTLNLGVKAAKGNVSFGANLGTTQGSSGRSDVTFGVSAKFRF